MEDIPKVLKNIIWDYVKPHFENYDELPLSVYNELERNNPDCGYNNECYISIYKDEYYLSCYDKTHKHFTNYNKWLRRYKISYISDNYEYHKLGDSNEDCNEWIDYVVNRNRHLTNGHLSISVRYNPYKIYDIKNRLLSGFSGLLFSFISGILIKNLHNIISNDVIYLYPAHIINFSIYFYFLLDDILFRMRN